MRFLDRLCIHRFAGKSWCYRHVRLPQLPAGGNLSGLLLFAVACLWVPASPFGCAAAMAQAQSDQISRWLGTAPHASAQPRGKGDQRGAPIRDMGAQPIRIPLTLPAGQSVVVRAGASTVSLGDQTARPLFKLGRKPGCGTAWETAKGIVLEARGECAGQILEFDYEVTMAGAPNDRKTVVNVDVQALVLAGVESCGIGNAPYHFIRIPGGSYATQNAPRQLTDLIALAGTSKVDVEPFCITEEAVPASEMEAFLAAQTPAQKRGSFSEALDVVLGPEAQVETGRDLRFPALAVSYRMAKGYAQRQSGALSRRLDLPQFEHYLAAALYLLRQQPDAPWTHSFLVSLRGGLMEWTDTPCGAANDKLVVVGTQRQSGQLDKFCYEASQRVPRMGFRLVASGPAAGRVEQQPLRDIKSQ